MSRGFDRLSTIAAALLLAAMAQAVAKTGPDCQGGVCTLNVDPAQSIEPCAGAAILLAWRQQGGATMIQCATQDGWLEQPSFVFDRRHPAGAAYDFTGVRFIKTSSLGDANRAGIADAFASHGTCKPATRLQPADGEIVLMRKTPSGNDKDPYCYRMSIASTTAAGVEIRGGDPDTPKADAHHDDWDKLAARMLALIPATASTTAPAASGDSAHVVHAKAPLRDTPDLAAAAHGYLVQGDAVTILDRSHAAGGWVKARYVGKNGSAIERWIRADDLGLAQPAAAAH